MSRGSYIAGPNGEDILMVNVENASEVGGGSSGTKLFSEWLAQDNTTGVYDISIDATITAQDWTYTFNTSGSLSELTLFIQDNTATNNIGEIGGLTVTNTCSLILVCQGITSTVSIDNNMDLASVFVDHNFGEAAAGNFFENGEMFLGSWKFSTPLDMTSTDYVTFRNPGNNLSSIEAFRIRAKGFLD